MKNKFITFSFDDGVMQDLKVIEILNKYGLKGTFNLNSGHFGMSFPLVWEGVDVERNVVTADMVKDVYAGHEVAVHTVNHARLKSISDADIEKEINDDIYNLEKLVGYEVRGMAYPCNEVDDRVIRVMKERTPIKYARTTDCTNSMDLQQNLLLLNPSCRCGYPEMYELAEKLISYKGDKPQLLYIWSHAYEFDYKPDKYKRFEEFCEQIANRNDIEYCTNIEVFKALGQI